jgi:hypothetical protein
MALDTAIGSVTRPLTPRWESRPWAGAPSKNARLVDFESVSGNGDPDTAMLKEVVDVPELTARTCYP